MRASSFAGCLLGTAVGDSLGLPYEGLAPARAARLFPDRSSHHLLFGRGMVSDDTEHACFTAQALVRARGDAGVFQESLARSLRWWLLGLPAGVGLATLKSLLRLWAGVPPGRSGVFSAGNGPAMRSPIIGVASGESPETLREFVRASTVITHRDPRAFHGAVAVAVAAAMSAAAREVSPADFLQRLSEALAGDGAAEMTGLAEKAASSAGRNEPTSAFAESLGCRGGVSGYILHTVPCALQAWFRHPRDFAAAMGEVLAAGGDTDTVGAIVGGIVGAAVGREGIPGGWLRGIIEWPRSVAWIQSLGDALAAVARGRGGVVPPPYFAPALIPRNALFLAVVLAHGFRRLAPPY